jgi:hypothetical protein
MRHSPGNLQRIGRAVAVLGLIQEVEEVAEEIWEHPEGLLEDLPEEQRFAQIKWRQWWWGRMYLWLRCLPENPCQRLRKAFAAGQRRGPRTAPRAGPSSTARS